MRKRLHEETQRVTMLVIAWQGYQCVIHALGDETDEPLFSYYHCLN